MAIVTARLVSLRIAPPKAAKGPLVAPVPLRFSGPLPKVYRLALMRVSCAPALIVKLEVAVGEPASEMRVRPPLRVVAPV